MKQVKKSILALVLFLIVTILLVLGLESYIKKNTSHLVYKEVASVPSTNTAIILGASVHSNGTLSPILQDRVDTALELYHQKKVKQFLVSGDHKTDDYDEVNAMSNYLMKKGVPREYIIMDHSGFDTYDSMYRANAVFGIDDAIVITQDFHLPRALFIAAKLDLNYIGLEAGTWGYRTSNRIRRREKLANFKALWEVTLNKEPTTLEKRLP